MLAVWLENKQIRLKKRVALPDPGPCEALVKVVKAGICSTDLEMLKDYYPFEGIPGHEFIGIIEKVPGSHLQTGQRVVGDINIRCGKCNFCQSGWGNHCLNREVLGLYKRNGAFAEYLTLPATNLLPVPDSVSDEVAVFTEPVAAALRIQEQICFKPTDRILLLGAGRLGQIIAYTIRLAGFPLWAVARYRGQKERLQAIGAVLVDENDIAWKSFDVVIEATGNAEGFSISRKAVQARRLDCIKINLQA